MPCLMNVILKVVKGCRGLNTKLEEQIDQVLIRYIIPLISIFGAGFHSYKSCTRQFTKSNFLDT